MHGKNHHVDGSFSRHIVSMSVLTGTGETILCNANTNRSFKNPKGSKFWNVKPSEKSIKKVRENIGAALKEMGLVRELNAIIRGWLNNYEIEGVSYPYIAKRKLNYYLRMRMTKYFNRKSQRKSRLYRKQAFELLT